MDAVSVTTLLADLTGDAHDDVPLDRGALLIAAAFDPAVDVEAELALVGRSGARRPQPHLRRSRCAAIDQRTQRIPLRPRRLHGQRKRLLRPAEQLPASGVAPQARHPHIALPHLQGGRQEAWHTASGHRHAGAFHRPPPRRAVPLHRPLLSRSAPLRGRVRRAGEEDKPQRPLGPGFPLAHLQPSIPGADAQEPQRHLGEPRRNERGGRRAQPAHRGAAGRARATCETGACCATTAASTRSRWKTSHATWNQR